MWELDHKEGWVSKIDASKVWCLRKLLRGHWTERISNQSILKGINPEYPLQGLMMKLKLQHFGHLMQRANSLEKTLMLGKNEGRRRRKWPRMRRLDGITDSMDMSLSKLGYSERQGGLVCWTPWGHKESDMTEQLNNNNFQERQEKLRENYITGGSNQVLQGRIMFKNCT